MPLKLFNPGGPVRLWVVVLLASVFWGAEYLRRDLWEPDEARYAYVANEMHEGGHWLVPYRSGEYYAHKPPLMFWMINVFSVFNGGDANRVTTRLPSLLGTILSLWAVSQIAARLFGGAAGWMAPMVLATSALFWKVSGMGQIDALLCGLQMTAFWLLLSADAEEAAGGRWRRPVAYLSMGMAVLAKGPVGVLIPFGSYVFFCAFSGQRRHLKRPHLFWGLLLVLLPTVCWLGAIVTTGAAPDGYFDELLFKQNIGRATGDFAQGHSKPVWYFLSYVFVDFLPWVVLLPGALVALWRDRDRRQSLRGVMAWFLFVFVFFSMSATKRNLYILMVYPAAAILTAAGWDRIQTVAPEWRRISQRILSGLMLVIGVALLGAAPIVSVFTIQTPVSLWVFAPTGLILTAGGGFLLLREKSVNCRRWLFSAATTLAISLWLVAIFVYPAINPLKAPYALVDAAQMYLPEGQDLLLYHMNGEIFALYCKTRGRHCRTPVELITEMQLQKRGMVVVSAGQWDAVAHIPEIRNGKRGYFRMGSKQLIWIAFIESSAVLQSN